MCLCDMADRNGVTSGIGVMAVLNIRIIVPLTTQVQLVEDTSVTQVGTYCLL